MGPGALLSCPSAAVLERCTVLKDAAGLASQTLPLSRTTQAPNDITGYRKGRVM